MGLHYECPSAYNVLDIRLNFQVLDLWSLVEVLVGLLLIAVALMDAFETIVLPRTVSRRFRLTYFFYSFLRWSYKTVGNQRYGPVRQRLLASFAPLAIFNLIALWGAFLILGFSLIASGLQLPFRDQGPLDFGNRLYFSATTFLTFGFGDFVPTSPIGKILTVAESGTGFLFLALVIGYVPVFYAAFSKRERTILILDSKAGSDPTATEIVRRHAAAGCLEDAPALLKEWELFSGQLLENFLSYPILAFYRSQHDDQSWLNSLISVMDASAIFMVLYPDDGPSAKRIKFQANATFTIARHLIVDFAYVIKCDPMKPKERLPREKFDALIRVIAADGLSLDTRPQRLEEFQKIRELYEPFAAGLSESLKMPLPEWIPSQHLPDNWETSAWDGTHF
jgi:hypothetical protein